MRLGTVETVALLILSILVASSVAHAQESGEIQRIGPALTLVPDAFAQRASPRVVPPPPRPPTGGFLLPPEPLVCPPVPPGTGGERAASIVSISDGAAISAEDIREFNAAWMTPDVCAYELYSAYRGFSYRQVGWGTAARMAVMARMHELTHDPRYLRHLRQLIEIALFYRDDHYPGNSDPSCQRCEPTPVDDFRGGHVAGWGGVEFGTNLSGISEDITGVVTYPIATFARIIAEDPSLQADYGPDAVRYANAAMETMWALVPQMNFQSVGNFIEGYLATPEGYRTKLTEQVCGGNQDCINAGRYAGSPLEYNGNGAFMMTLIELWRALDSPYYRSSAPQTNYVELTRALIPLLVSRFQRFFVDHLITGVDEVTGSPLFYWNYSDGGPSTHAEDVGHGALDMRYLDVLRRNFDRLNAAVAPREPIALDNWYLTRFANTFLWGIAQHQGIPWGTPGSTDFAHDVYGNNPGPRNNTECDGWVSLAVVDASVYSICREVSLRLIDNGQPYLTIGNHSALLMNKR